jgi:hypothetical protein
MSYSLLRPATRALVVVLVCLVSSTSLFSQSTGGRLLGRVADPSGAVLAGVKVTCSWAKKFPFDLSFSICSGAMVGRTRFIGDVIYSIDRISETALVELFTNEIARHEPIVLIGEGLPDGRITLPKCAKDEDARWRVIVDHRHRKQKRKARERSGNKETGAQKP